MKQRKNGFLIQIGKPKSTVMKYTAWQDIVAFTLQLVKIAALIVEDNGNYLQLLF
jgi:hypothetical protein